MKLSFDSKKKAVAPAPSALELNANDDNISIQITEYLIIKNVRLGLDIFHVFI